MQSICIFSVRQGLDRWCGEFESQKQRNGPALLSPYYPFGIYYLLILLLCVLELPDNFYTSIPIFWGLEIKESTYVDNRKEVLVVNVEMGSNTDGFKLP